MKVQAQRPPSCVAANRSPHVLLKKTDNTLFITLYTFMRTGEKARDTCRQGGTLQEGKRAATEERGLAIP